ncbi:MAG: 2-phospho-L-lactate guanylyltransferase [Pelotomaculum sp. PtaB.Bin104]|nr:MAG: 2-phospho-L-lactate guanylyltransferase [Pelotomaculum sp. PtaB.Bin104]
MLKPALAIMSRTPSTEGKSRLGGVLSPAQREALQWAFLKDTLDKARLLKEFKCYLAITPPCQINCVAQAVGLSVEVIPQPDGDLGQRMLGVAQELFIGGHSPVILIGTDVPSLPPAFLLKALALLEYGDLVFGPAFDGGYYLIGMRRFESRIFENIDWGTASVLEETVNICRKYGLAYSLLEPLADIDQPRDILDTMKIFENNKVDFTPVPARTIQFFKSLKKTCKKISQ